MGTEPKVIIGGLAVDERGQLTFHNDFDFKEAGIRRFYMIQNHKSGFIRAWHGHKIEAKYITVVQGAAVVKTRKMTNPREYSSNVLSAQSPKLLYIPPGYYNGIMTLTDDAIIVVYSTTTLEESKNDDFRMLHDMYDKAEWEIEYR